ncbi:MAG: tetratricopeptide repeat protein [Pseudonocardia sp.]
MAETAMVETTLEPYQRARMFFDAQDFVTAARLLAELVEHNPDDLALRLLLARAYYHSAQLSRPPAPSSHPMTGAGTHWRTNA